jgi:hypothetical protein
MAPLGPGCTPQLESRVAGHGCAWRIVAGAGQFHRAPAAATAQEREACAVAQRKAPIRWRHGLLPGMVRLAVERWTVGVLARSPAIVSWAQNCERADGASGEHRSRAASLHCKAPRRPSRARQQGRSLRYCGRRRPPAKRGQAPPSHQQP